MMVPCCSPVASRRVIGEDGARILRMSLFKTRFSRFLVWRDLGWPDKSIYNCFSMPAVRARDGAYLLGEMGPSHSFAGQLYFPCGTPDPSDIVADGCVDLDGSLVRELAEETGLASDGGARGRELDGRFRSAEYRLHQETGF